MASDFAKRMADAKAAKKAAAMTNAQPDEPEAPAETTDAPPAPPVEATEAAGAVDSPPAAEADAAVDPTYVRTASAIDATVLASTDPQEFDPNGTYVVVDSAIGLGYGEQGAFREPAMHGELVAAAPGDGIIGLARPAIASPAAKDVFVQTASDGVAELRRLWEKGAVLDPRHERAIEARRNRLRADAATAGTRGGERLGDVRLQIVAGGGSVIGYASGVRV